MAIVHITEWEDPVEAEIEKVLVSLHWETIIPNRALVFIKPNLTYPTPKHGVTTSPEFIEGVLKVISSRTDRIIVGESDGGYRSWPAEMAFHSHHLPEICKRYGARLVNLSKEPRTSMLINLSKGQIKLDLPALLIDEVDSFITLPVPKIHQITGMSGAIKNQWGCIPDTMRLTNHPYFDELVLEINRLLMVRLALADGKYFLNETGPMVDGIPVQKHLVIGSDSIGAMDAVLCRIMGIDYRNIRYLNFASKQGWIPSEEEMIVNVNPDVFCDQKFYLKRTLRNRLVSLAFDRPWAVKMIWDSKVGDWLHKVMYLLIGNRVQEEIKAFSNDEKMDI